MKIRTRFVSALAAFLLGYTLHAQVPQLINYQGRVAVGTVNFDGSGQFKFALVNGDGTTTYWSNDGTSTAGSQPANAVTLTVTKGLYSVLLGDATLPNMTVVPATVFANADVRLRVWFNDGTIGTQLFTPDQRIAAAGYAMIAASAQTVPDGSITATKMADGSVTTAKIAAGAVTNAQLATGAVANATLANSGITITAGTGLGGGGAVSLGGTVALTNAGVRSLAGGGGITVNAATGTITLGSNATSANIAGTIVQRDASGNFSAGTITGTFSGNGAGLVGVPAGSVTGVIALPVTTSSSVGVITQNGFNLLHTFGTNNFFAGSRAGNFNTTGSSNTASGVSALSSNTTGSSNTATGRDALFNNTVGISNTANGFSALRSNTTASGNVAIGVNALYSQSFSNSNSLWDSNNVAVGISALETNQPTSTANGKNNTAVGTATLRANTTGAQNTALGGSALFSNTVGANNTAIGYNVLTGNTTGIQNTATGISALENNLSGNNNTAVGISALESNSTGNNNTALGNGAGRLLTSGSNNIAIGNAGVVGESNTIRIGTPGTQTTAYIAGRLIIPILTITGGADVAEPFPMSTKEIPKGAVVVIDDKNTGELKLSERAYDQRVAGIVSGANGINPGIALHQEGALGGGQNVSLSGRVYVLADAAFGSIRPGDLLTTSDTPGHAMKATEPNRAQGAVLGKAMSPLKEGRGVVLVLVTLQ